MLQDCDAACSGYLSSEAPECFVCAESGGELLSNICACRGRHVHLSCLRTMRQQTPAHSERCAVCLTPYDSASDPMAPPTELASKAVDSAAKLLDHLWPYLLQSLFLVYGALANCPYCPWMLRLEGLMAVTHLFVAYVVIPRERDFRVWSCALWRVWPRLYA
jgi:hypothetical protein